ncbi:MAG: hypothetical protein M1818_000582 [Claussenomyces sp. TS43310]|nr:MAG: hypothetical protein M1818_000582 [Claussenomyces sp. TS43310]
MSQFQSTGIPLTTYASGRSNRSQQNATAPSLKDITPQRSPFTLPTGNSTPDDEKDKPYQPGGRRHIKKTSSNRSHDVVIDGGGDSRLNAMGKFYKKLLEYSFLTRYTLYILPVAIFLMILIVVFATAGTSAKVGGVRLVWVFTWLEAVWLTLFGMKAVAMTIPLVFAFFMGAVSPGTKKYARILKNLEQPIMVFGWVVINFVLFEILFSTASAGNTPHGWTKTVKSILGALLIAVIIFLVEKTFIQFVSISYHARSFNNKIEESRRNVHLLALLFDASRNLFPMYCREFSEEDYMIHSNIESFLKETETRVHKSLIRGPGRALVGMERLGNKVNTVFGNIAAELTGRTVLSPRSAQSIVTEALQKTKSAKALAQRLWFSFVVEGRDALRLSDLEEVLGPQAGENAEECFSMLDVDGNDDVSLDEMIMRIAEISTTRKAIARSMRDVSQAIRALDQVLSGAALLFSVFALICFLDNGFSSILSTASSTLISLSFVFSTTAQEFFASCIFLFVKHPYDIDDSVDIWGPDGTMNRLSVEQISLFYTSFKRIDNMEWVQIPNNVLNGLWINNVTRSKAMIERIDISISFDTSIDDLEALRAEMESFVRAPENNRDFQQDVILHCNAVGGMDKLQLILESNWSVETLRAARHSKLMCALVLALRKVPIYGPGGGALPLGDPGNPAYNVAVSDADAAKAREKAAKDANLARLNPNNAPATHAEGVEGEQTTGVRNATDVSKSEQKGVADANMLTTTTELAAGEKLNARKPGDDVIRQEEADELEIGGGLHGLGLNKVKSGGSGLSGTSGLALGSDLTKTGSGGALGRRRAGRSASMSLDASGRPTDGVVQGNTGGDTLSVPPQVASRDAAITFDADSQV